MPEQAHLKSMFDHVDYHEFDVIALEHEARRLRAQAIADAIRTLTRWSATRIAALRGATARQHA